MYKPTHKTLSAALIGAAFLTANAGASVLFTDDFSSTTSGSGFSDNWSGGTISGGEIDVNNTTSFRQFTSTINTGTMDFWFVSNLTVTGTSSGWAGLSFFDGGNEDGFFGSDGGSTNWEFDTDGMGDQTSTVANFTGVETLLITHITSTSIDMWIDPADISSAAAMGAADKAWTGTPTTPNATWDRIRIGTSRNVKVNDMTAATTFSEAVPEPSSAALLGLGGLALILRRRK